MGEIENCIDADVLPNNSLVAILSTEISSYQYYIFSRPSDNKYIRLYNSSGTLIGVITFYTQILIFPPATIGDDYVVNLHYLDKDFNSIISFLRNEKNKFIIWGGSDNLLWKQYNTYVDIFKFYINVTWQVITWFYAITGAILVYYFDHVKDNSYLRYALVLPAILSFGFYQVFAFGAQQNKDLVKWLNYIRGQLSLPGRPHVEVLGKFLELSSKLFLLVSLGLIVLFLLSFTSLK
jgi:hypothetical protein